GWIYPEGDNEHPWCVILTELPAGAEGGDQLRYLASFDGYFFKLYKYKDKADKTHVAPLLIGHASLVRAEAEESSWLFLVAFLALVSGTVILVIALAWWLRRSDARVRAQLAEARKFEFVEPGMNGDTNPAPPNPPPEAHPSGSGDAPETEGGQPE